MAISPLFEPAEPVFAAYVEEIREFLATNGVPFGSPEDLPPLAARLGQRDTFSDDLSSLVRSFILRRGGNIPDAQLMEILSHAVAGPQLANDPQQYREPLRQLLAFVSGVVDRPWNVPPGERSDLLPFPLESVTRTGESSGWTPARSILPNDPAFAHDAAAPLSSSAYPMSRALETANSEFRSSRAPQTANSQVWSRSRVQDTFSQVQESGGFEATDSEVRSSSDLQTADKDQAGEGALAPDLFPDEASDPAEPPSAIASPESEPVPPAVPHTAAPISAISAALAAEAERLAHPNPEPIATPIHPAALRAADRASYPAFIPIPPAPMPELTLHSVMHPAAESASEFPSLDSVTRDPGDEPSPRTFRPRVLGAIAAALLVCGGLVFAFRSHTPSENPVASSPNSSQTVSPAATPPITAAPAAAPPAVSVPAPLPMQASQPSVVNPKHPARSNVAVSSRIMAANLVSAPKPDYPASARKAHVRGQVTLQAVIAKDGSVTSTRVLGGNKLLRAPAQQAVRRWRYHPYRVNGHPVDVSTIITVRFRNPS